MPDRETNKQAKTAKADGAPTTAPEVPDDMNLTIVDSTASPETPPEEAPPGTENASENPADTVEGNAPEPADPIESEEQSLGSEEQVMPDGQPPKAPGKFKRFFRGYWRHKRWTLLLTLLVIVAIVFAVPATRYKILGYWLERSYEVTIMDSKTNTPVSGASVMLDGQTKLTDSAGKAKLTAKVGKRTLAISKQYYKKSSQTVFIGIRPPHKTPHFELDATGRQVPIRVVNKITNKPIRDAEIKVLDTEAKTDASGKAIIVLPTAEPTQAATVAATGYNKLSAKVEVTDKNVPANTFAVVPSGRVYFLSNLSGTIDVVSSNLDGTSRQTVLAGTGSEDANNTTLLASRDWKYLALLSKRDGPTKLYLIDTTTGQHRVIDDSNATFSLVGWSDHSFVYEVDAANGKPWQPNQHVLKSFNAQTGQSLTLDRTAAEGNQNSYAFQTFGDQNITRIVGDNILYFKQWNVGYPSVNRLNGKKDQILSVRADGSGRQVLKEIPLAASMNFGYFYSNAYKPQDVYIGFSTGSGHTYYEYKNGYVTQSDTLTDDAANKPYPTYLVSPSDNQTFWSESRDGKNTLLVGDGNGANERTVATLSDYQPYGWFSDNYLLVSKDGSELYILPTGGGKALKVTDYYKVARPYNGYGGL